MCDSEVRLFFQHITLGCHWWTILCSVRWWEM